MLYEVNFEKSIQDAFLEYGSSVAQDRAIVDVRDALKPGLRQGLYAQYSNKLTHDKPYKKALKSVAAATSQSYTHGDSAMYDTFVRTAKPWAVRYLLEDAQGAVGSPCAPDDHTASRYLEMRASELSSYFFKGLKKNAIGEEWYDNYDDTEKIPGVFPSIGYWNLVNGCQGIAVAMSTSIPTFNLREVNAALVRLIRDPNVDFNEIYCPPDFPTYGTITNASEVKESLKNGHGAAIRIKAKLEYNSKENSIVATELPYGVYTNTVCKQLAELTEEEDYGIAKILDKTKKTADIHIYLSKNANPTTVMKKLYKDTSLESFFSINMIMLDQGRFPKVFGWREACQAYIGHIRACKRREVQFDMDTLIARNHILEGLLTAIAHIDDVVKTIRSSDSAAQAKQKLKEAYGLDDDQTKAILDMKLQRLANLEAIKINKEYDNNVAEISRLGDILGTPAKLDELLIVALEEVAAKFGDARRTRLTNQMGAEEEETEVWLNISKTAVKVVEEGRAATKISSRSFLIVIDDEAKMYRIPVSEIIENGNIKLKNYLRCGNIIFIDTYENIQYKNCWMFATKNQMVKKSLVKEYNYASFRSGVGKVMKLKEGDKITECALLNGDEEIFHKIIYVRKVAATGKAAMGVSYEKRSASTPEVCCP